MEKERRENESKTGRSGLAEDFVTSEELLEWTRAMVAIPSYSGRKDQEAGVGRYIKEIFDGEGIECRIAPLKDGRCNVYARLPGKGGGRSLLLNGHMDTVPAYGMEKAYEPWTDENGFLHGRGTSDMKGPLAAMMGAVIALKRSGAILGGDLIFCGVADEEGASLGTVHMLKDGIRADAAIVGEALGPGAIGIAQKGLEWFRFDFEGRTVHGGQYQNGVNAIYKAVDFINAVRSRLEPELVKRELPLVGKSTVNIGVIQGGTQLSTVAGKCSVELDRRFLPGAETYEQCCGELEDIIDRLAETDPDFHCTMHILEESVMEPGYVHAGFFMGDDEEVVKQLKESYREVTEKDAVLVGCPCWTDAGLIYHYGHMPVVIYGPGHMEVCHSDKEYIDPRQITECYRVYTRMAAAFCRQTEKRMAGK